MKQTPDKQQKKYSKSKNCFFGKNLKNEKSLSRLRKMKANKSEMKGEILQLI